VSLSPSPRWTLPALFATIALLPLALIALAVYERIWPLIVVGVLFPPVAILHALALRRDTPMAHSLAPLYGDPRAPHHAPRSLDDATRQERVAYSEQVVLPARDAPAYSIYDETLGEALRFAPSGFAMTPAYLLDRAYRILDWNEAFGLVFDRTMEGRTGQSVLEWTYFLDNYQEVMDHGSRRFADPNKLPAVDVEPIEFTSTRYGKVHGTKRAYRMPGDNGATAAWLVTIEPQFDTTKEGLEFKQDLIGQMSLDLMWSEYALSYDHVLLNTSIYTHLTETIIGDRTDGPLAALPPGSRILDLGAGTGNVANALASKGRRHHIIAIDANRTMLECLKAKCNVYLTTSPEKPGVFALRQNLISLFGIPDASADCAIMNNVLYAIADHQPVLQEVLRVLKPGGELRISGPHAASDVETLFREIRRDLEASGRFEAVKPAYERVYAINKLRLAPMLRRWATDQLAKILLDVGFSEIVHSSETIYTGQSMLIFARK
jgi:ubiquinone/menaquinone biosynthesis C-methylase UbiE/PAS domain-containing protein